MGGRTGRRRGQGKQVEEAVQHLVETSKRVQKIWRKAWVLVKQVLIWLYMCSNVLMQSAVWSSGILQQPHAVYMHCEVVCIVFELGQNVGVDRTGSARRGLTAY